MPQNFLLSQVFRIIKLIFINYDDAISHILSHSTHTLAFYKNQHVVETIHFAGTMGNTKMRSPKHLQTVALPVRESFYSRPAFHAFYLARSVSIL